MPFTGNKITIILDLQMIRSLIMEVVLTFVEWIIFANFVLVGNAGR